MKLTSDEYRAFEDIVGPEYITQEPVIGESYNQVWGNKLEFGQKHTTPPAAILLPSTPEEIQKIVRECNKYGILFKALSSGFELVATTLESERGILLDLRRMNRILEIDPKNMHAVVEPYVSNYKLQLEAAKFGLYTGKPGVGYSAGVIAVACCHQEMTISQIYTSGYGRNVLGCEWVLPTGDLLELGTSGRPGGWYSADGPGFSLRGILRGRSGANGGHGVITKAAIKLYPWYGPAEFEMQRGSGEPVSAAQLPEVPGAYRVFVITFPTNDQMLKASSEIARAELCCILCPGFIDTGDTGEGNDEQWARQKKLTPQDLENARKSVGATINGHSQRELAFREKCLMAITEKWGGYLLPDQNNPQIRAKRFMYQMWSTGVPGLRATGDFMVSLQGSDGSPDMQMHYREVEVEAGEPFVKSGALIQSLSGLMYRPMENMSVGCSGGIGTAFDPWDPVSLAAARKYLDQVYDPQSKFSRFGYTSRGAIMEVESIDHIHQRWGPLYDNCDLWLRKVKKALDPNSVADWSCYIPPEYPDKK
jgi:glycolate oxidase